MKRRIYWVMLLLSAVGVVCASILTLGVTASQSMKEAEKSVCQLTDSISTSYNYMTLEEYKDVLTHLVDNTRATLITEDGTVLFDSNASAAQMENHLDRPEIQDALKTGTGEDARKSSTTQIQTYYYAVRLSDNCVLRLARQYSSLHSMVLSSIPGIIVVMVVLFGLAFLLSRRLTMWMMRPVEQAVRALDQAGMNSEPYAELKPFFSHIREQDQQIHDQEEILRQERETLGIIANNMREGQIGRASCRERV